MRIKSHWFRSDRPRTPEEIAGAAAFIAWRVAQNALKTMRAAHYELPPGRRYFAFVAEFLVFLTLGGRKRGQRPRRRRRARFRRSNAAGAPRA